MGFRVSSNSALGTGAEMEKSFGKWKLEVSAIYYGRTSLVLR